MSAPTLTGTVAKNPRLDPLKKGMLAVALLALALSLVVFPAETALAAGEPYYVHLSWQNDPSDTMTVTWNTDTGVAGYQPTVQYGLSPGDLADSETGSSHSYIGATVDVHVVELDGLSQGTDYYYRCGDPSYSWSEVYSFETPPSSGGDYTFCVVTDSQNNNPESTNFEIWNEIATAVDSEDPLFSILVGDFVSDGNTESDWNKWFTAGDPLLGTGSLMGAHGNHEKYATAFFERFSFPGNERWYSFDVCDTHFVCLDTGLDANSALIDSQVSWLEQDLENAAEDGSEWTVVYFHIPPYSGGSWKDAYGSWVSLFDEYGVDLQMSGHYHYYQRSFPLRDYQVADDSTNSYYRPGGTIYMICGTTGGVPRNPNNASWTVTSAKTYGYIEFEVEGGEQGSLKATAKTKDGGTIESFTLYDQDAPAPDPDDPPEPPEPPEPPDDQYFAEGYTGEGFQEYLCLGNTGSEDTTASVTYMFADGTTQEADYPVPANGRTTVNVNVEVGTGREVSIRLNSPVGGLVAERPVYFDYRGSGSINCKGGHNAGGYTPGTSSARQWYFAEGCTREEFDQWITVQNPGDEVANLILHYMVEGEGEGVFAEEVGPTSRATFSAREHVGEGKNISLFLESDQDVVAERPVYFDYRGLDNHGWEGGHCVAGVNAPAREWFFAEGTTRGGFEEWLCMQNPGESDAAVTARYLLGPGQGEPIERTYLVPARERLTLSVNQEIGADKDVSIELASESEFIAERPVYFYYQGEWQGGHDVLGATATGTNWFFAEGCTKENFAEWLCIQNPGDEDANVALNYYPESGSAITKYHVVEANSRCTIDVNSDAGPGLDISTRVESDQPVICERPMYFLYDGWCPGGHDVVGYSTQ